MRLGLQLNRKGVLKTKHMTRNHRVTLLILVVVWQTLVWLTPWGQAQQVLDLANNVAHAQAVAHQHHDDQSLHLDDLVSDAAQHHHVHESFQFLGLLPEINGFALDLPRTLPFSISVGPIAAAFLQGPFRPPQAVAV